MYARVCACVCCVCEKAKSHVTHSPTHPQVKNHAFFIIPGFEEAHVEVSELSMCVCAVCMESLIIWCVWV